MSERSGKLFFTFHFLFLASLALLFFAPHLAGFLGDAALPPQKRPMRFFLIGLFSLIFLFYHFFLTSYRKSGASVFGSKGRTAYLCVSTAAVLVFLCFSGAVLSSDLYEYSLRARMFALYGMNPYLSVPSEISTDMFYRFLFWKNTPECYGPAWVIIGALHAFFFRDNFFMTVFAHKFVLLVFLALSVLIFRALCGKADAKNAGFLSLAFFLNPLVLVMTVVDGHNEIAMVFFMLGAVYMLYRSANIMALLLFTLATHVKFIYLLMLPFIVFYVLFGPGNKKMGRRMFDLVVGFALSLGLSAALWRPFGIESVKAVFNYYGELGRLFWFDSVPFAVYFLLDKAGMAVSKAFLAKIFSGAFLAVYVSVLCYFLAALRKNKQAFFNAASFLFLALFFTNYTPFQSWYLLWVVPFILLSGLKNKYPITLFLTYFLLMTFWKRMCVLAIPMIALYPVFIALQRKGFFRSCVCP